MPKNWDKCLSIPPQLRSVEIFCYLIRQLLVPHGRTSVSGKINSTLIKPILQNVYHYYHYICVNVTILHSPILFRLNGLMNHYKLPECTTHLQNEFTLVCCFFGAASKVNFQPNHWDVIE